MSVRVSTNLRGFLAAGVLALGVDQIAKASLLLHVAADTGVPIFSLLGGRLTIIPIPSLTLGLGLIGDWPLPWQAAVFGLAALLVAWLALVLYRGLGPGEVLNAVALGFVLGGAVGNVADLLYRAAVIDIIGFGAPGGAPAFLFNFADAFMTVGIVILGVELLVAEGASRVRTRPSAGTDG